MAATTIRARVALSQLELHLPAGTYTLADGFTTATTPELTGRVWSLAPARPGAPRAPKGRPTETVWAHMSDGAIWWARVDLETGAVYAAAQCPQWRTDPRQTRPAWSA